MTRRLSGLPEPTHLLKYTPQHKSSGLANAALVTALCGVGEIAVVLGHVSLRRIKKGNGQLTGRGTALAGLIIGYAVFGVRLLVILLIVTGVVSLESLRTM